MTRVNRPRALTKRVRELILHRSKDKSMSREALADKLIVEIEGLDERAPTIETLVKMISKARNQPVSPLDRDWRLDTVLEYPLNPEAIVKIMKLRTEHTEEYEEYFVHISIRAAQWIARLVSLPISTDVLLIYAKAYSFGEQTSEILHMQFDSSMLDSYLIETIKNPEKALWTLNDGWDKAPAKELWETSASEQVKK